MQYLYFPKHRSSWQFTDEIFLVCQSYWKLLLKKWGHMHLVSAQIASFYRTAFNHDFHLLKISYFPILTCGKNCDMLSETLFVPTIEAASMCKCSCPFETHYFAPFEKHCTENFICPRREPAFSNYLFIEKNFRQNVRNLNFLICHLFFAPKLWSHKLLSTCFLKLSQFAFWETGKL